MNTNFKIETFYLSYIYFVNQKYIIESRYLKKCKQFICNKM